MSKPKRDLSAIEADICATLKRGTADIIKVGELLCEAKANKAQIPHGEWGKWLGGKFSLSERSAQKYMRAYKWSRKTAPDSDLSNLSPSAIYLLSAPDCSYTPEAVAAILKEAKEKRVGEDRAYEIHLSLLPEPEPEL